MAIILDKLSPEGEIGERLGRSLGSGLRSLTEAKLGQLQRQAGLSALMNPQQAQAASYLPEGLAAKFVPQFLKQQQYQKGLDFFTQQKSQAGEGQVNSGQPTDGLGDQSITDRVAGQGAQQEEALANKAAQQAFALSNGDMRVALKAKEDTLSRLQQERFNKEKKEREFSKVEEGRITKRLDKSSDKADKLSDTVQTRRESIHNYKNVKDLLKTGAVDTSLIFQAKSLVGLEASGSSPETQLAIKFLAAEPIRSLASIPGQAARLSKVFDQIYAMNGTLKNTEEGLHLIADSKITEAKSANLIDREEINLREAYDKARKRVPLNLRDQIANDPKIKAKLAVYNSFITKRISDSVIKREPDAKLSNFKTNQIIRIAGTNEVYKKIKSPAGFFWAPATGSEKSEFLQKLGQNKK